MLCRKTLISAILVLFVVQNAKGYRNEEKYWDAFSYLVSALPNMTVDDYLKLEKTYHIPSNEAKLYRKFITEAFVEEITRVLTAPLEPEKQRLALGTTQKPSIHDVLKEISEMRAARLAISNPVSNNYSVSASPENVDPTTTKYRPRVRRRLDGMANQPRGAIEEMQDYVPSNQDLFRENGKTQQGAEIDYQEAEAPSELEENLPPHEWEQKIPELRSLSGDAESNQPIDANQLNMEDAPRKPEGKDNQYREHFYIKTEFSKREGSGYRQVGLIRVPTSNKNDIRKEIESISNTSIEISNSGETKFSKEKNEAETNSIVNQAHSKMGRQEEKINQTPFVNVTVKSASQVPQADILISSTTLPPNVETLILPKIANEVFKTNTSQSPSISSSLFTILQTSLMPKNDTRLQPNAALSDKWFSDNKTSTNLNSEHKAEDPTAIPTVAPPLFSSTESFNKSYSKMEANTRLLGKFYDAPKITPRSFGPANTDNSPHDEAFANTRPSQERIEEMKGKHLNNHALQEILDPQWEDEIGLSHKTNVGTALPTIMTKSEVTSIASPLGHPLGKRSKFSSMPSDDINISDDGNSNKLPKSPPPTEAMYQKHEPKRMHNLKGSSQEHLQRHRFDDPDDVPDDIPEKRVTTNKEEDILLEKEEVTHGSNQVVVKILKHHNITDPAVLRDLIKAFSDYEDKDKTLFNQNVPFPERRNTLNERDKHFEKWRGKPDTSDKAINPTYHEAFSMQDETDTPDSIAYKPDESGSTAPNKVFSDDVTPINVMDVRKKPNSNDEQSSEISTSEERIQHNFPAKSQRFPEHSTLNNEPRDSQKGIDYDENVPFSTKSLEEDSTTQASIVEQWDTDRQLESGKAQSSLRNEDHYQPKELSDHVGRFGKVEPNSEQNEDIDDVTPLVFESTSTPSVVEYDGDVHNLFGESDFHPKEHQSNVGESLQAPDVAQVSDAELGETAYFDSTIPSTTPVSQYKEGDRGGNELKLHKGNNFEAKIQDQNEDQQHTDQLLRIGPMAGITPHLHPTPPVIYGEDSANRNTDDLSEENSEHETKEKMPTDEDFFTRRELEQYRLTDVHQIMDKPIDAYNSDADIEDRGIISKENRYGYPMPRSMSSEKNRVDITNNAFLQNDTRSSLGSGSQNNGTDKNVQLFQHLENDFKEASKQTIDTDRSELQSSTEINGNNPSSVLQTDKYSNLTSNIETGKTQKSFGTEYGDEKSAVSSSSSEELYATENVNEFSSFYFGNTSTEINGSNSSSILPTDNYSNLTNNTETAETQKSFTTEHGDKKSDFSSSSSEELDAPESFKDVFGNTSIKMIGNNSSSISHGDNYFNLINNTEPVFYFGNTSNVSSKSIRNETHQNDAEEASKEPKGKNIALEAAVTTVPLDYSSHKFHGYENKTSVINDKTVPYKIFPNRTEILQRGNLFLNTSEIAPPKNLTGIHLISPKGAGFEDYKNVLPESKVRNNHDVRDVLPGEVQAITITKAPEKIPKSPKDMRKLDFEELKIPVPEEKITRKNSSDKSVFEDSKINLHNRTVYERPQPKIKIHEEAMPKFDDNELKAQAEQITPQNRSDGTGFHKGKIGFQRTIAYPKPHPETHEDLSNVSGDDNPETQSKQKIEGTERTSVSSKNEIYNMDKVKNNDTTLENDYKPGPQQSIVGLRTSSPTASEQIRPILNLTQPHTQSSGPIKNENRKSPLQTPIHFKSFPIDLMTSPNSDKNGNFAPLLTQNNTTYVQNSTSRMRHIISTSKDGLNLTSGTPQRSPNPVKYDIKDAKSVVDDESKNSENGEANKIINLKFPFPILPNRLDMLGKESTERLESTAHETTHSNLSERIGSVKKFSAILPVSQELSTDWKKDQGSVGQGTTVRDQGDNREYLKDKNSEITKYDSRFPSPLEHSIALGKGKQVQPTLEIQASNPSSAKSLKNEETNFFISDVHARTLSSQKEDDKLLGSIMVGQKHNQSISSNAKKDYKNLNFSEADVATGFFNPDAENSKVVENFLISPETSNTSISGRINAGNSRVFSPLTLQGFPLGSEKQKLVENVIDGQSTTSNFLNNKTNGKSEEKLGNFSIIDSSKVHISSDAKTHNNTVSVLHNVIDGQSTTNNFFNNKINGKSEEKLDSFSIIDSPKAHISSDVKNYDNTVSVLHNNTIGNYSSKNMTASIGDTNPIRNKTGVATSESNRQVNSEVRNSNFNQFSNGIITDKDDFTLKIFEPKSTLIKEPTLSAANATFNNVVANVSVLFDNSLPDAKENYSQGIKDGTGRSIGSSGLALGYSNTKEGLINSSEYDRKGKHYNLYDTTSKGKLGSNTDPTEMRIDNFSVPRKDMYVSANNKNRYGNPISQIKSLNYKLTTDEENHANRNLGTEHINDDKSNIQYFDHPKTKTLFREVPFEKNKPHSELDYGTNGNGKFNNQYIPMKEKPNLNIVPGNDKNLNFEGFYRQPTLTPASVVKELFPKQTRLNNPITPENRAALETFVFVPKLLGPMNISNNETSGKYDSNIRAPNQIDKTLPQKLVTQSYSQVKTGTKRPQINFNFNNGNTFFGKQVDVPSRQPITEEHLIKIPFDNNVKVSDPIRPLYIQNKGFLGENHPTTGDKSSNENKNFATRLLGEPSNTYKYPSKNLKNVSDRSVDKFQTKGKAISVLKPNSNSAESERNFGVIPTPPTRMTSVNPEPYPKDNESTDKLIATQNSQPRTEPAGAILAVKNNRFQPGFQQQSLPSTLSSNVDFSAIEAPFTSTELARTRRIKRENHGLRTHRDWKKAIKRRRHDRSKHAKRKERKTSNHKSRSARNHKLL